MDQIFAKFVIAFNAGKVQRRIENGIEYAIATITGIVPGVLAGSDGAIFYPESHTRNSTRHWDGMPIVVYHPYDPIDGTPLSAGSPGVVDRQGIGTIRNSVYRKKLKHEAWIDLEKARKVDQRVYNAVINGDVMEVSSGLYLNKVPAPAGSVYNGKVYEYIARDFKPDHMAILPDQVGACSVKDGCGLHVNEGTSVDTVPVTPTAVLTFNYDVTGNPLITNVWTEKAREAAAQAHHARAAADKSAARQMAAGGQPGGAAGGKKAGGAAGQDPVALAQLAHQTSTAASARGIASVMDLLHVEYAHALAAYQYELAAAAHAQAGDTEAYEAHKKAAEAHRKTAMAIRKKIAKHEAGKPDTDDDDDDDDKPAAKKPVANASPVEPVTAVVFPEWITTVTSSIPVTENTMALTKEQRDAVVAKLTANCSCDADKAALTATLNAVSEAGLALLIANAQTPAPAPATPVVNAAPAVQTPVAVPAAATPAQVPATPAPVANKGWGSVKEWMDDPASAPAEVKAVFNAAIDGLKAQKDAAITRLIANVQGDAQKAAMKGVYEKMQLPDLVTLLNTQPTVNQRPATPLAAEFANLLGGAHFLGAASVYGTQVNNQAGALDDLLPLPGQ